MLQSSYSNEQDSPIQQRVTWPKMAKVPKLRNLALEEVSDLGCILKLETTGFEFGYGEWKRNQ